MRVISGTARGRTIIAPPGRTVRPTSDRVRGAIFNALTHRGLIDDAHVLDLFAGSGSLGIEALSRGAAHATFVERDASAVDHLRANLEFLGFESRATVVRADALRWIAGPIPTHTTLVLADPPYEFAAWPTLLEPLHPVLAANDGLVVVETRRTIADTLGPRWQLAREQRYGGTVVAMLEPSTSPDATADEAVGAPATARHAEGAAPTRREPRTTAGDA